LTNQAQKIYKFLPNTAESGSNDTIPRVFLSLLEKYQRKIHKTQELILLSQRAITMHYYLSANLHSTIAQPLDPVNSRLLFPPILKSLIGMTNLVQSASSLIHHIIINPAIFADIINENVEPCLLDHFAFSVIPSVYGFFSSEEMIQHSLKFYLFFLEISSIERATKILIPFFHSGITSPYVNRTLDQFFIPFSIDTQLIDGNAYSLILSEYSATFMRYCSKNLLYLPQPIILILQKLIELKWSSSTIFDLFFKRFMFLQALSWGQKLKSQTKRDFLDQILLFCEKCDIELLIFIDAIKHSSGSFSIPPFELSKSKKPFTHFVCVNDSYLLAKAINDSNLLPLSMCFSDFCDYPPKKRFYWFNCEIYMKEHPTKGFYLFPIGSGQEATFFEILTDRKLLLNRLRRWKSTLSTHHVILMKDALIPIIQTFPPKSSQSIPSLYYQYATVFRTRRYKQLFLLISSQSIIERIPQGITRRLTSFCNRWNSFMNSIHEKLSLPSFSNLIQTFLPSSQDAIIEAMRLLQLLDFVRLPDQYFCLIKALTLIDIVAAKEMVSETLFFLILERMPCETFLSSFVLLSAFAMKNTIFSSLTSEEHLQLCIKLEALVFTCLSFEKKFMLDVVEVGERLMELANPVSSLKKAESAPSILSWSLIK